MTIHEFRRLSNSNPWWPFVSDAMAAQIWEESAALLKHKQGRDK